MNEYECAYCGAICGNAYRVIENVDELPVCYECFHKILYRQWLQTQENTDEYC